MSDSREAEVLRANASFYDAFRAGDFEALDAAWARNLPVACIHPGWQILRGRELVMQSWRSILFGGNRPDIHCDDTHCHLLGDFAFVTCLERIGEGALTATNVFAREDSAWRLVHHQAGPLSQVPNDQPSGPLN
ncbi:nuclear transport factor 2 family protein [Myxococcota bacterium]|nr:nuclear transport factor 2 family protein [Myxococcota bacterium]